MHASTHPDGIRRPAALAAAGTAALVLAAAALALPHGVLMDAALLLAAAAAGTGWMPGRRAAARAAAERDRRLLRETAARAFRALDEVRATLGEATDTMRRFARGLYPPALDDVGLAAAVRAYADTLSERGGPRITLAAADVHGLLSRERELALYRVLQEALANAVRHAGARSVEVRIARRGGEVVASVEDDGAGFDVEAREAEHPCLGLLAMRERALYAGGGATVESAPGRGTRIRAALPVETSVPAELAIVPRPVALAG